MPDNKLNFLLNYKKPISQSNSNIDLLINRNQSQQKVNQAIDELPVFLNNREDLTLDLNKYETRFQTEFTDAVNSFRRGIDQTQISNYQGKLDAHQEVIDNNVDKKNKLIDLHKQGKINSLILGKELQKIEQEDNKAFTEISKYQSDIENNKLEMQDEYVSKMYQMKEALVQAKGGDAGLWESIKYTMPSTAGSSASLMGQQIAATWGTGLIKKIITSVGAGAVGGPVGEFISVGGTLLTTAALIGNSRYQETMAEIGGQLEQNQQKLLEKWQEQNPDLEPDEEVLRKIRMAARKGKDEMFKEQMMLGFWDGAQALLAPGSKVLGAFKTGRKLEKAVEKITDYNKYTRAGSTLGKFYIGQKSEGFEEGFQYATSKRQEDAALGLGLYENKDFMTNLLTDSYDTVSSMNFGPFKGDGRYADDKEFQFSVKSGELLSMLPGAVATAKSMYDDISTYRKTNKELQQSGIANPEDKFFKLKDQIYVRHFDNNTVSYLLEGVRNLGNQKNEKGIPYLNETEVQTETKNIQEAFDKYLEVSKHIEDIIPEGRFNIKYSPEQVVKIAALKSELFHSSMNLTRYAHKFPTIETVSNINNLIKHNENLVKEIESTLNSDYTLRNVYHLNDRLSLAKNKLSELNDLKKQFLEGSNLEEKDIPEINSVEESNKNKEYVINDLNLSEEKKKYEELLKVKDNETLDIWFDNFIKKQKTKKKEITKQESKIKLAQETDINLFAQDVFNKVKDPAAEENIEFYNANKEAIDKQIAILQAAKDKKAVKDVFGDPIDEEEPEDFDNIDYNKVAKVKSDEKEGKKAETVNKTELGWDGDIFIIQGEKYGIVDLNGDIYTLKNIKTNSEIYVKAKDLNNFKGIAQYPSQERLFRFTENSDNIEDYELAAITKRNNPELYNELLDLQENELNKDGLNARQTDEEDSIYFVLVDKNHNPVLVDGVKLFSYMTRPERYTKKELKVTEEDIEKLKENRELILNSNDILFFNVIDKSDGTLGFESKDNNQRISKPVVGTIYDDINEVELEVVTLNASTNPENTYGFLSKLPGKIVSLGRLYAIFKNQTVDLIPRTLNDKEINKIAELLLDRLNNKPDISKEIEKLIFFGYGRKEENPTRVAVSKGILYLGDEITMDKTNFDIEVVKQFLKDSGKKVTVNKSYLESNKKFKDIFGVEHKSYQSYLLTGEDRLYGTDLKDKGEGQLLNQYLIYNPTPNKNMNKLTSSLPEVNTETKEDSTDVLNTPSQVNPDSFTTEDKKADIEKRRQEEFDRKSPGNSVIAADYLFTGGKDVMLSTDYLLQALTGAYPAATKALNNIRSKYASQIGNIKDDVGTDVYNSIMEETRQAIKETYTNPRAEEIFNKILENATGFTFREGNTISAELEKINEENDKQINAKYDAELAALEGKETTATVSDVEVISENYTPELLRANPNKLFLFGDNNTRTGKGGQAIIRDEPNAMGISTKLLPNNTPEAFMSDADLASNKAVINDDIYKAKKRAAKEGKIIVLPKGGFGTGLAALATKAPKTFEYLNRRLQEEFGFNNTTGELAALKTKDGSYTANAKAVIEAAKNKVARVKRGNNGKLNRLAPISKNKRELTKEEIDWFVSKFPNIPIEIVKGLIEAKSLGQFLQSGKVLLSDKATYGTLYHEAFHVVTQLYLTKKEIDNLYAEALKNNPGKTRLELEEILAEDFINYKETGQVLKGAPTRNTLFRKIINFIKDLLQLSAKDIKDVYRRIDKGYYTNKKRINNQEFNTLNKLADKTEQETKEILDGFTAMFFKILKADNKTTLDAYKYKDAALNEIYDQFITLEESNSENETFTYILDNFETIANTWVKKMNSLGAGLKEYNVIIDNKTINEEDEGTETSIISDEEKSRQDNGYTEANLTSVKSKMFNSTKFLIRGLVQVNKDGSEKLSSIGLPIPVDFDKTYTYLLKNLVGLGNDYEVYYNKLTELAKEKPELNQLKDVLKAPNQIENLHTVLQQTQFVQDFNKNKVVSYITLIEEQGKKIYLIDATKQAVSEGIKDKWAANLKSISKQNNEGKLIIDLESLKGSNNVEYLAKLGLVFSPETIKKIENSKDFNDAVQAVRNYLIKNNGNVTTLFEDRDIKNRINTLAFLESEFTPDTIELSYMNSENKTVYSIAYNNYLSALKNKINNSDNLADLYAKVPHLQSVTSENSYWISKLFKPNGKRDKSVNIDLNLQDGLKNKDTETGTSTSGLTIGDKLVQEINSTLLNGLTSFIRASDKATEHTISLSGVNKLPIDLDEFKDDFNIEELTKIFQGYFQSEFKRIALFKINKLGSDIDQYNKSGDKWTTFSFISSELKDKLKEEINKIKSDDLDTEQLNDKLNTVAETYYDNIDAEVIEFFNNYLIKQKAQLAENKITLDSGISSELKGTKITKLEQELENAQFNEGETLSISKRLDNEKAKRLDQLLRATIVTDLINSIEQTKIFTGDMAFYKDLFKRMSAGTGGKEFCRNDRFINNFLNKNNKRLDKKLADGNINVTVFNDVNLQSNYLETYQKALEKAGLSPEQAQALLGFDEKDPSGYYNMDEGDAQGWITMDEYREFMIRLGDWDNLKESTWEKLQRNESITSEEMVYFISKKAQYFGPQEYDNQLFAPAFHKYSLMPLIPSLIKGTNMEVLLETMQKPENKTGYALFKTGSKVGTLVNSKGKATKFYTNTTDGEINTENWIKQVISYEYLGLQQKSSKPHDTVIFGTQFRKLVLSNLFESGVVNENFSEAKELLEEYNKIINELITKEKDKLVKELGLNPALNYVSEDATKLVELLKSEAENRALPTNLIDSLQVTQDTKTLRYKFDSMVNKAKIDSMLMSIINSRLIRQKMNGDALIQGASSGFEPKGVRIKESNTLKFYSQEGPDGITTHAEVMIAMNDNYRPLLKKYNGDLDALNKAIEEGKVDKRLLQMVGYRIPTQGLNSMDMLQVKKFLPESSATLIILPTDIVAKSGGDYDIDKMNVFRPSMDKNGNYINTPQNRLIEISTKILQHPSNFNALIIPNSTKILTDLVAEVRWIEHVNDKPEYKGTIEDYQKDKKDELNNIQYIEQLMLSTKTKQFQKFMLAKDMIGVAAVQNTAHIIAQLAGLTLNKTYTVKTKEGKKIEKNRHISFKHHTGPNNTMDLGKTFDVNGKNKISEVISQIINATVDAAKDPFLFDLNMNLDTLGTYAYLIRIGVPFDTVVYFMKQPIISKYLKSLSINQSEFLGLSNQEAKGKALAEAKNEFILDDAEYGNEYLETKVYENEELKSYLSKDKQVGDDFKANQLHILNKFLEYQNQASMLSDSIKANNHDTAGLGKSLYTSFMKRTLNAKVKEDNFVNNLENLVNTPIAGFNQVDFSIDVFSQFYDSYNNRTIKNNIDKILNNLKLFKDEDIIKTRNLIENDFINYVVQNYGYDNISKYSEELFKSQSVAKQLLKIKNNPETNYEIALSNNMLIKELFPLIDKAGNNKDNIKIYSRKYDTFTADQLTEAFKELEELGKQENQRLFEESGNTEDLNKPTLAKQIMDVGIIQSGLNNSPITYLGIIPYEYYNELVKESFDNFDKKNGVQEMYKFEQLFQRENPGGKPKKGWIYGKNYDINSKQDYQVPIIINESIVTQTNETIDNFKNSFEYNNLKVETDFQLSEDQDNALRQLIDFIKDRNKSVVTLEGAAGTGKTSIIGYLQKYLSRTNSFAYLAPTHAATVQLAFSTAKIGNKDFPATLASAISIDPKTGRNKFSVKIQKRLGLNPVIVVDESSMIDNSDIDKLLEAIEDIGGKLILMGDEKQIPKASIVDSLTKQLSGAFTRFEKIKLSKVHRQSNNKLLNILNKMREQISFKLFKTTNSEAVKFVNKREYNELLVNDLLTDPENTMVISYTNDSVKGINNQARKVLGREGETQVGDIIVGYLGYASKQVEKSDIANSINYTITKIEADGPTKIITAKSDKLNELVKLGIKGVTNTATTTYYQMDGNDSLQFDDLTQEEFEMNNDLVSNYFRDINKANIDFANKQITYFSYQTIIAGISESLRKVSVGQDYIYNPETDRMEVLDPKKHSKIKQNGQGSLKMNKDIDYGHAITIHKSQGSTINNVYFDTSSLNPERDIKILDENGIQITTEKMALAYVAMSRSKNKLVVYEHNLDFELLEDTPETPTQVVDNSENISQSEENSVSLQEDWNTYKDEILKKDKEMTFEIWSNLSEEIRQRIKDCL